MKVTLTEPELTLAGNVGVLRNIVAMRDGAREQYGSKEGEWSWEKHIMGALGECAVAKHYNLFWSGTVGEYGGLDVGKDLQVRAITNPYHRLMIHTPKDKDRHRFILVLAQPPAFTLLGWVYGEEGKRKEYWDDPTGDNRPCYFVPQKKLRAMDTLEVA